MSVQWFDTVVWPVNVTYVTFLHVNDWSKTTGDAAKQLSHVHTETAGKMVICDGLWWFVVVHGGLCWSVVVSDGPWWSVVVRGGL